MRQGKSKEVGFSATSDAINPPKALGAWQAAGDQRLFKLIVSLEFGERPDLRQHTRQLLARMERDLGTHPEWVAVAHFNTGHPHVHIASAARPIQDHSRSAATTSSTAYEATRKTCAQRNWDFGPNSTHCKPSAAKWTNLASRRSTGKYPDTPLARRGNPKPGLLAEPQSAADHA